MIVVSTPAGLIGRQVLGQLLDNVDEPVRVIVRDPARLSAQVRDRVEVIQGSLTDAGVLRRAVAGAHSLFWLLPPDPRAASAEAHLAGFARPLREVITGPGRPRLVYVTGLETAVARSEPGLDELIAATGVSYRALPCPAFMDNLLQQAVPIRDQGVFGYPVAGDRKLPSCATRDIAAVAAGLLADRSWTGPGRVPVLGPEDLSYDDMAAVMSEVLGRPVRYQQVPGDAFRATLIRHGWSQDSAQRLADRLTRVDQGLYNTERRTPESTTPTSFRQWCHDVLRPAVLS